MLVACLYTTGRVLLGHLQCARFQWGSGAGGMIMRAMVPRGVMSPTELAFFPREKPYDTGTTP